MQSMKPPSLTCRLTLLFAFASAAVLLALGLLIAGLAERHFEELDMEVLAGKMELAQQALRKVESRQDLDTLYRQFDASLVGHSGLALAIRVWDGKDLRAMGGIDFPQFLLERDATGRPVQAALWKSSEGKAYRGISAMAPTGVKDWPPALVAVAMDLSPHEHFMTSFQKTLWSVVVLAAIATGLLGWMVVRRGLAPVRMIKRRASEITANRLDHRLEIDAVPVELAELVQALNAMLSRLEESFRRLSDFSADLAHELRTPVNNLLTQTQVILSKSRTAEEYREVLFSNQEEFERLSRMIADMLFLAKADHGLISPFKETVDVAGEVSDLLSFYELLADGKNIRLSLAGHGHVVGDRMLLRRAISNLLSNAIRYTPDAGKVHVAIESVSEGGELLVSVENTGEPIPSQHIPRLFDRFYRADASRQGSSEGAGLGLAITKSIIGLHGGTISVQCGKNTTRFEVRLPSKGQAEAC